jgi:uncharacterized protein
VHRTMSEAPAAAIGGHRLLRASSAYLRSAAEQAIDWYPWGEEPFALAQRLGRPVLLDIGAAWCHWCHVMDEGTYSDPEVARLINERFVAVKVDRDELPEIDRRYQRQVNAISGEGGWPLTGFLTPGGEAFLGGTYFPPNDYHGRPGLKRILREVDRVWREEPDRIRETTEAVAAAFERERTHAEHAHEAAAHPGGLLADVQGRLASSFDPVHGGFGSAPKFPHPSALAFLLWSSFASGEERPAAQALETMRRMADGGMYDQVGGGFHRYSVDEGWHIPHFEKMGVDNAALLAVYEEAVRWTPEPRLVETVRGTAGWIESVLALPEGGYGASQDADNAPGDDGQYFTWSRSAIGKALDPAEARLVRHLFGLEQEGRMPHDPEQNVLYRASSLEDVALTLHQERAVAEQQLAHALATLRTVRAARPVPAVDRACYANINGVLLGALTRAGRTVGEPTWIGSARRAADRFLAHAYDPARGVAHRLEGSRGEGFGHLEDNAAFAAGLVELAGATAEPRYADAARELYALLETEFWTPEGPLQDLAPRLYDGPKLGALVERLLPLDDSPNLSPNAMVALGRLRFAALTGQDGGGEFDARTRALVGAIAARLSGGGVFASGAAHALGLLDTPAARVVIVGGGPEADALARTAERTWHPNLWVFRGLPPPPFSLPGELEAGLRESGPARALVCFGTSCRAPITAPKELAEALRGAPRPRP